LAANLALTESDSETIRRRALIAVAISDNTVAIIGTGNSGSRLEMFGDRHEYGALGRTETVSEAPKAI
jgi:hypothetical protein